MKHSLPKNKELADFFLLRHEQSFVRDVYDRPLYHGAIEQIIDPNVTRYLQEVEHQAPMRWPNNAPYALCITHDVDYITTNPKKFIRRAMSSYHMLSLGNFLRGCVGYVRQQLHHKHLFETIVSLEKKYHATSTFFFMATEDSDQRYDITKQKNILSYLEVEGAEIGLHAGMDSYNTPGRIAKEKQRIESVLGHSVIGVRQHYLRLDQQRTWQLQQEAGFLYDSTLAYPNVVGFRNGVAEPFMIPFENQESGVHAPVLEISLMIMDGALFSYMRLSPDEAWVYCKQLLDTLYELHGAASILWHVDQFNEVLWPGSAALYEKILAYATQQGAWLCNGKELYTEVMRQKELV